MEYIQGNKRITVLNEKKEEIGEITWTNAGESLIIIDHTFVENDYRGQGIAEKLVALSVDFARVNQVKVLPLCPFAKKEFDQKTEYHDVLK
ncbi:MULTISPECIES: GNAT family N-acetyltransferase [Vagococcus]|uniref:GNAT family N-acetyltransferase n=1 Tax=Vagococcus TaxID=2737 RepID=UPI002FC8D41A